MKQVEAVKKNLFSKPWVEAFDGIEGWMELFVFIRVNLHQFVAEVFAFGYSA